MQFEGLLILTTLTALAVATRFYLKLGTNYERSYFFHSIQKKKFDQLVIDLVFTNYLNEVAVLYSGDLKLFSMRN